MRFRLVIISYVLTTLPLSGSAQSIVAADTLKAYTEKLIEQSRNASDNPEKRYNLSLSAVNYSKQVNDNHLQGKALLALGQACFRMNKFTNAIENANQSLEIFIKYNDSLNLTKAYNLLGICFMRRMQYEKAINYYEKSLQISISRNDSATLASGYNNLGTLYYNLKQFANAKTFYSKGIEIYRALGEVKCVARTEGNIGLICVEEGNYNEAIRYFISSKRLREELHDTLMLASIYDDIGNVQEKLGNYSNSLEQYTLSNEYFRKLNNRHGIALSTIAIARIQLKLGNYNNVLKNIMEGQTIAIADNEDKLAMQSYKLLSDYYLKTGNTLLSRQMLEKYIDIFEKSYNETVLARIAEFQLQLDTIQKERDYKLLSAKLEVQQLQAAQNNRLKTFYFILAILLLVLLSITLLFIVQQRKKNKAIKRFNQQLFQFNNELEKMVRVRTQDLSEALEKVKELEKIKSAFLSNISHEIRTPLNGILGFTQHLVSPDTLSDDKQQCSRIIQKLSAKLLRVVDDILELSKIETNQLDLHLTDTNINGLLGELYQQYSSSEDFASKNLHFRFIKSLPDSQAVFSLDSFRVKKIMANLIENAFKFTAAGSIEFGYHSDSPSTLKFFVKDTGIGIPAKYQKRIFERFYKHIAEEHTAKYDGTGVGLTIAKGYALSMGGRIEMESSPGNGSTFYIYIPKKNPKQSCSNIAAENNAMLNDKTILVVEDDLISYQYINALMQNSGARLIHVKNAEDAIEVCNINENINLVLMDIQLPFMDGIEATKIIRNTHKKIPIIAQSANALSENGEEYINAGCNAFIAKPIDPDELFCFIKEFIQ